MQDAPDLLPRDKLLRDSFTTAEAMLYWLILLVSTATFCIGEPRSFWLLGGLIIVGALTPAILKTHEHTHPFFIDKLWPMFWLCSIPVWGTLIQLAIGQLQHPLTPFSIGDTSYSRLEGIHIWLPTTAADNFAWITAFGFSAAYLIALLLFLIPKSRAFFERLLPLLCTGAVSIALLGYLQQSIELANPILTKGTGFADFFALFPYDGHWAAFATLWCCTCISMALLSTRYEDSPDFVYSSGPWYLTGGALLGATGFLIVNPIPAAVLLLTLTVMLSIVSIEFMTQSKDTHRNAVAISCGLAACLSFAAGIFRLFQAAPGSEANTQLRRAAIDMFQANPVFGWGFEGYSQLLPFFSNDHLLGQRFDRANSDILQLLAEFGLFGAFIAFGFFALFLCRYFWGRHNIQLTNHLLIGCAAVMILAIWDSPFMSPTVFFSFFLLFFTALRWADLSRNKVDEVDAARPQLVTPANLRRVPFFNKTCQDKEK
ncbi:MAG: O-antigen ligase domain-containing protein [Puniceicoccaceae bacterium]|nr:MAG: O-antigen ligase domain-containing protein [Puniceicoccaceae bacterium]